MMTKTLLLDASALVCYCIFIFWLSDQPSIYAPMWFPQQDKIYHGGAFFIMGILAWRSLRHTIKQPIILASASFVFCSFYGFSDEWHQFYVPGRSVDALDWLADSFGALLGIGLMQYLAKTPHCQNLFFKPCKIKSDKRAD